MKRVLSNILAATLVVVTLLSVFPSILPTGGIEAAAKSREVLPDKELWSVDFPKGDLKHPASGGEEILNALQKKRSLKKGSKAAGKKAAAASTWDRYASRYYYQYLTKKQREIYDILYASLNIYLTSSGLDAEAVRGRHYSEVYLHGYSDSDLKTVFYVFLYENPQFFFVDYLHSVLGKGYLIVCIFDNYATGSARVAAAEQIKAKIQTYINAAAGGKSAYEKEKIVHDKLIAEVDYEANDYDQCIASTFLLNKTVCAGYSQGFSAIMNYLGIPTICVLSQTHAWNEILLGGKWYVVDCTWDDDLQEYGYSDFYLNVPEIRVVYVDAYLADFKSDPSQVDTHVPMAMYTKLQRPKAVTTFKKSYNTGSFHQLYGTDIVTRALKKPVSVSLKKKGSGKMVVSAKRSGFIDGYQIRLTHGSAMRQVSSVTSGDLKKVVTSLKKKAVYKVQIRSYRFHNGKCMYSPWTGKKALKVA
jgi:hypothetical protein